MNSELIPHVDENDQLIDVVEREKAYTQGLLHRDAHMLVRNSEGMYLIQRRQSTKATWPDYFDISAAETMKPDESYEQAALRGLYEELGITVSIGDLQLIRSKYIVKYFYQNYILHGIVTFFLITHDGPFNVDPVEVGWTGWLSKEAITQKVMEQSEICTPWFVQDWQYYIQHTNEL